MLMLILETFLLMLLSALLGTALGHLLAEAYGSDVPTDRPWLRDWAQRPAAPALPTAPQVMPDAERDRLLAALSSLPVTVAPVTTPSPAEPDVSAPGIEAEAASVVVAVAAEPAPPVSDAVPEAPVIAEADVARAAEADAHGARPAGLHGPREGRADDLKRIKGIGKQNETRLNALGIWHFDQIAAWSPENIAWAGSFLAFVGRIDREDWVGQAKVLATGGSTEFAQRVDAGEVPSSSS